MSHLVYLALLFGCLCCVVPLEFCFGTRVLRRAGLLALTVLPAFVLFTLWDLYAIAHRQWSYDRRWLTGWTLPGHLPVEEALFFVVVPIAAVLTYEAVGVCLAPRRSAPVAAPVERADR